MGRVDCQQPIGDMKIVKAQGIEIAYNIVFVLLLLEWLHLIVLTKYLPVSRVATPQYS